MTINRFKWLFWVGFFLILALPLLNLPPWFSPPDWGKTIVFRIILSILIFLFICQFFSKKTYNNFWPIGQNVLLNRKSKVFLGFWLLITLFLIFLLATIFSLDRNFSLWGSPYRSGGFVNFAFYIIFAILTFLILKKDDWQKIWDFTILIGIFVSIVAIFQQFGLISKIFIPFEARAPSTIGGPIFLAIYLLLLSFLALSFGLQPTHHPPTEGGPLREKNFIKKPFYFLSFLLFLFVAVFITQTRAVIIGYMVGFLFFIFFYPTKKFWIFLALKLLALIVLILGIYGIYFVNTQTELPQFIQKNKFLLGVANRLSVEVALEDPRISGWKVSWEAMKERPILGYGPENFAIGFDKYYDPSVPHLAKEWGSWWDRAHNFIFDIGVTAGIPALIIYLLLFGVLFWQLQRLKNTKLHETEHETTRIVAHGIQATFIGYLVANFFSFDTFSTYLISFLLIAYALHLIADANLRIGYESTNKKIQRPVLWRLQKYKGIIIFLCFVALIWFIWAFNIKPFQINTQINLAEHFVDENQCNKSLSIMENILPKKSFLDNYLRLKYVDFLKRCGVQHPTKSFEYAKKGAQLLKENIKIQPYYVRNWLSLSGFTAVLIDKETNPEIRQELIKEVNYYLEKAEELSSKRQEVFIEWSKWGLVSGEFQKMKEKSQKCIEVNPKLVECYWFKGLSEIALGNFGEGKKNIEIAEEKRYASNTLLALTQLAKVHGTAKNYQELVEIYLQLISINPEEPQYHASLAFVYKELGEFEKAKKEAQIILELAPEFKEEVETFLRELP